MATNFLSLSIGSQDDRGAQVSGFPPQIQRGWTGNAPTVRRFTLAGEDDTEIEVPASTKYVAAPLQDAFNLFLKGEASDTGVPLCFEDSPLGLAWGQPWDGSTTSFFLSNGEEDDQIVEIWFY